MSTTAPNDQTDPFLRAFRGRFSGILRWPQFDELWQRLEQLANGQWYLYAVGEAPPDQPASATEVKHFLQEIQELIRKEHDEDYCGIVYVDDKQNPGFVKIFDPNNLGVSCGSSKHPPLPGWIISKLKPVDLPASGPQTASRQRWWQKLFSHLE